MDKQKRSDVQVARQLSPYEMAAAYVAALTTDAVLDWRCLHDTDKTDPGHVRRGKLADTWPWLMEMNGRGYGCFLVFRRASGAHLTR
jgi:hypothetical protein